MKRLASYVCGAWNSGDGAPTPLYNPATEEVVAETTSRGVDFGAALDFARTSGGPALRELSFSQRGDLLRAMSKAIHAGREELIALAVENGGNTRGDAKFDIDGAIFTLAAYADLGSELGDARVLADGDEIQIGRTARLAGQHVLVPRRGVAVHVNAFNFPAWGLAEKAAAALLAGMPVVSKPATATAVVAHRMVELFVEQKLLPPGALSLICGGAGDLLEHLRAQDVLAFTGSGETAKLLRAGAGVVERSVRINVEADSLNAAVLAPDVELSSETGQLFLADVTRDITQKAGQKCTAIRRIFAPADRLEEVVAAIAEKLADVVVGNPADSGVRMGPVASRRQLDDVRAGIDSLAAATDEGFGGTGAVEPRGVDAGTGYFVGPVLRVTRDPARCRPLHEREIFGPVATACAYSGDPEQAADLVRLGGGGLVASLYSDDREFFQRAALPLCAHHGRLYLGSAKIAAQSPGPGTVLPQLLHGGPGRAGGGEELGGRRGMLFYQQRTALQGDKAILAALTGKR